MNFENEFIKCNVAIINNCKNINIKGKVFNRNLFDTVILIAPNPVDNISSFSGHGLPFPNAEFAFENTKNKLLIDESGIFNVNFTYPNSYYNKGVLHKIVSSIFFICNYSDGKNEFIRFELKDLHPLKSLVNRESRKNPEFYYEKSILLPIDTAFNVMKEYKRLKIEKDIA